jgi:acyl carrier protein
MDTDTIKARLTPVFRDVFGDDQLVVTEALTAADVRSWDSVSHINLIVAVEKEFKIRLTTKDARSMKNVGDLIALVRKKAA